MPSPFNYIIFSILIFTSEFLSQTIESVEIIDNGIFSRNELLEWSGINPDALYFPAILDSAKGRLASALSERGYFNSSFDNSSVEFLFDQNFGKIDSQKIKIVLSVKENAPTFINKIIFQGSDSVISRQLLDRFDLLKGQIFNKDDLEENISELINYCENNGYPFVKIRISSVYLFTDSSSNEHLADIHIKVEPGIKSRIDRIEIEGNTSTKDYVILRELRLNLGDEYSQTKIDEMPKRLNRLRFFEPVENPQYFLSSDNKGVLQIRLKEKQTNSLDGIIGYLPATNSGEKGTLTGLINVSLRNLFGTGRAAAVRWHQFNRFSQELELKYLEPWILGYPFNISGGLYQRKQDSSYVQRKLEGAVEYLASEDLTASVFIATESVIPSENGLFTVYNSNSISTGINFKIDTRDDPYAPTEGLLIVNSYSFSRKKINGPFQFITPELKRNINLKRFSLSFNWFRQIFNRQVIALGLNGRELRGNFFEQSDLFRLGGTLSLRGYREEQFLGSRIGWTNLEYRLLLSRRTFAFIFFDTGYFFRQEDLSRNIVKSEGFKVGYGLGLNIETTLGVLGVSFALAQGDSFSDGKIHFGIINEF
jgi:outer membrane protein insertion porin family